MHAKKLAPASVVMREGRWRPTTDPIEKAELFGQLQGVTSAKSLIAHAASIAEAIGILEVLEERYASHTTGAPTTSRHRQAMVRCC